jgi:hypothetical protein
MMDLGATALLLGALGIALLCLFAVFMMFMFLLRATGGNALTFLSMIIRNVVGREKDDERSAPVQITRADLRSKAQMHDFDTALAQQAAVQAQGLDPLVVPHQTVDVDNRLPPSVFDNPSSVRGPRLRQRMDKPKSEHDDLGAFDEIMGDDE